MFLTCGTTLRLLIFLLVTEKSNCIRRKFLLYTEQVTWNDAYETCKHDGGQLLKLYSVEEDFVLEKFLTNQEEDDFWIGLNTDNRNPKKESDFVFADCQPLSWSNWDGGFDGSKQAQCVFAKKYSRLWIREYCDKYASFICDIPIGECTYEIATKTCPTLEADKTVETHFLTDDNCRSLCETRIRNGKKCYAYHMSNRCVLHHSSNPYFCDASPGSTVMNLRRCYSYGKSSQKFEKSLESEEPFMRTCTSYEPNNDATTTTTQITITEPTRATDQATTTEYTTTQHTTATNQPTTTEYTTTQPTTATNQPTTTECTTTQPTTATDQSTTTEYTTTQPTTATNQPTTTEYTTTQLITTETTTKINQPTTAEPTSTTTQPTMNQPTTSTPSSNTTTQPTTSTESTSTPSNEPTATNTTTETTTSDETQPTTWDTNTQPKTMVTQPDQYPSNDDIISGSNASTITNEITTKSQSTEIRATEPNLETLSQNTDLFTTKSTIEVMESEVCFCDFCGKRNMTAIEKEMEKVRNELKVNNAKLSSTRRKKESAIDNRPSAQNIGYIGIILFVALFGSIILLDITKIYSDVKT